MEIAGSTCAVCGEHVVLAREGKYCPSCRLVVHAACDDLNKCSRCGKVFEIHEPPIVDIRRDAFVPRSLRPSSNASPSAMVVLAAMVLLFAFAFLVLLFHH